MSNGTFEKGIQQKCTKAISAYEPLTKYLWSISVNNEVKLRFYLSATRPIVMYGSKTWVAPNGSHQSMVMKRLDWKGRKLLRWFLGHLWPGVCHNEDLRAEINVVLSGRYRHLAPPSKIVLASSVIYCGDQ
ncbi:hypothetical protein RB195_017472 [Necator americanus]|uniref:Uncharacterized protein n=1 Tax=Necator americanus TaxID=51031 RepID=A0ABR1C7W8_NECAM